MRLVLSRLFGLNLENTSDAYLPEIIGPKSIFNAIFCVQKPGTLKREKSGKNVANFYALLLVNTGKSLFSENFPQLWLFAMGGLFILVVVLMPDGLAGLWNECFKAWQTRTSRRRHARDSIGEAKPAGTP